MVDANEDGVWAGGQALKKRFPPLFQLAEYKEGMVKAMGKAQVLAWRLVWNHLPTVDNLHKRGIVNDEMGICCCCQNQLSKARKDLIRATCCSGDSNRCTNGKPMHQTVPMISPRFLYMEDFVSAL
ncbi:hypothetical protein OROMI_004660 [Orobanche minor]